MIVEIDDDFADTILVATLADSYSYIKKMVKSGKNLHEDDLSAFKELLPAMELVGGWYSTDFKAAVKAAKKKK